jgi:hypothetical protein
MHNQHQQAQAQQQYHSGEPWQQGDSSGQVWSS